MSSAAPRGRLAPAKQVPLPPQQIAAVRSHPPRIMLVFDPTKPPPAATALDAATKLGRIAEQAEPGAHVEIVTPAPIPTLTPDRDAPQSFTVRVDPTGETARNLGLRSYPALVWDSPTPQGRLILERWAPATSLPHLDELRHIVAWAA